MNGTILKISRYCTDDGPGIRSTIFLKGCPLSCKWCHNPESQNPNPELVYYKEKCVVCGTCAKACPNTYCHKINEQEHIFTRSSCLACGVCVNACPMGALEIMGKTATVKEIVQEVKKDAVFYQTSGGGVTISGGEPLYQPKFTAEILKACKNANINTAIETSGYASEKDFLLAIKYCDLVLFDIKDTNEERHKQNVGVPLLPILNNLKILEKIGKPFILRAPIIPTFNDTAEHFKNLKVLAGSFKHCLQLEIMPYHTLGNYKYALLQRHCACEQIQQPSKEMITQWKNNVKL